MSMRNMLALLIGAAFLLFLGLAFLLGMGVAALYSEESFSPATHPVLSVAVFVFSGMASSALFFFVVNVLVVRPLRRINAALLAFADHNERIVLPEFAHAPGEILDLATIASTYADRVEESHARDAEISRMKSDFISTAAHQFRTPLTGIRWALEALEKEQLTESQMLLVKSAVEKSHDLVGIVGTLLDISSIESGKYQYKLEKMDMQALVHQVALDFVHVAEERHINFRYEPGPNILLVNIDSERMKWVLNNLVENALHYTPEGGSVTVTSETFANRVIVKVRDTGIGIPQSERNNIFERFYRAGNAIAKENKGNGLGLYIARTVVKDHGGELSFEPNAEGLGTTFTLALPFAA